MKVKCIMCFGGGNSFSMGYTKCPHCKGKGYMIVKKTKDNYLELKK
jgi:DnaJ-class molecular chaperone